MAEKYSAEWLEQTILERGANWLDHHRCGVCSSMVGYKLDRRHKQVFFKSACSCSWSPDRPSSLDDIASWLAMQRSDEVRDKIMEGLRE